MAFGRPNIFKIFGSAAVPSGTPWATAWGTPGTTKAVRLMGGVVELFAVGTFQVDLLQGTAEAAATIATFALVQPNGSSRELLDWIDKTLPTNTPICMRTRAGTANVVATFAGREIPSS